MPNYQITIPASGLVNITNVTQGFPKNVPPNTFVQQLYIQNNSAHAIRIGQSDTSTTVPAAANGGTAGKGLLIQPGGALGPGTFMNYNVMLSDKWIAGTATDVIDIDYNL